MLPPPEFLAAVWPQSLRRASHRSRPACKLAAELQQGIPQLACRRLGLDWCQQLWLPLQVPLTLYLPGLQEAYVQRKPT